MAITTTQVLSVRLPSSLVEAIQRTADQRGISASEVVRSALLAHLELDPETRRHATVLYEIAKTRAVLLRLLDTQLAKAQVDKLLALAEGDATDYVRERLGGDHGTV
jgi:Arc/MetJ-type ribon-helix-helix transcriptional regulator